MSQENIGLIPTAQDHYSRSSRGAGCTVSARDIQHLRIEEVLV